MAGSEKRQRIVSELELNGYAGRMEDQCRLVGAPLELAPVVLALAEIAAQPLLQHLARQPEGLGRSRLGTVMR